MKATWIAGVAILVLGCGSVSPAPQDASGTGSGGAASGGGGSSAGGTGGAGGAGTGGASGAGGSGQCPPGQVWCPGCTPGTGSCGVACPGIACPPLDAGCAATGCAADAGRADAKPAVDGASGRCADVTAQAECEARTDCHAVFVDPGTCGCAAVGCCARYSACADGDRARCTQPATFVCRIAQPFCEGPVFVVAYTETCYEGCVHAADCQ